MGFSQGDGSLTVPRLTFERQMTHAKKFMVLSWILGLTLFGIVIAKIGPAVIWATIRKLTWWNFLVLFMLRGIYWIWRTTGWAIIYREYEGKDLSFFHLFAARMADHAISYTTPSAFLGGEPVRVLMTDCTSRKKCLASVVVDKTVEILTMAVFIFIGAVIAIVQLSIPGRFKVLIAVAVAAACFFGLFLFFKQRQGLFMWLINILAKVGIRPKFLEKHIDKIRELDAHISDFYKKSRKAFAGTFACYLFLYMFWALEIHLTLVFLGETHLSFVKSFLVVTMGSAALVFPFIPGSLGTYELTNVILFAALGLGTQRGITLTIIRRILSLLFVGLGLLLMVRKQVNRDEALKL